MAKAKNGQDKGAEAPAEAISNTSAQDAAECFIQAKELKRKIAQHSQTLAATYARFENMGVDTESIKECLKLERHDDPPGKMKRIMTMAAILNMIPAEVEENGQMTVLPGLTVKGLDAATKEKLALAQAYNDGYNTGLVGGSETNNKYEPGSEARVKWSLGHIDGQAQRAINKPGSENVTESPTVIRPRGRPRKNADATTQLEKDEASYRGVDIDAADPPTTTIQ